jgi:small subunit ribosomal protein S20
MAERTCPAGPNWLPSPERIGSLVNMPNIKSAAKRLRQSTVRRTKNRSVKRDLRTRTKHVEDALEAGSAELAEKEFRTATKKLDQAAAHGTIHRNAAARTKSRLSARIKAVKGKAAAKA